MEKQAMSPVKGLGTLLAVIVVIGGYIAVAMALHLSELWAGFLFLLYWSMAEEAKPDRIVKAATGSFVGAGTAALMALLPAAIGMGPGMAVFGAVVLVLVYAMIMGWARIAVNMGTMIFLTVATIPHIVGHADYKQIFFGIASGIAYFGGLALIAAAVARRKTLAAQA